MNRILCSLLLGFTLLTACAPAPQSPTPPVPQLSPTAGRAAIPTLTATASPQPTDTVTAPAVPTPTITPPPITPPGPHALALDEHNAATQLERLMRLGQGTPYDVSWSPDGKYLAIATGLGVFLYDAASLEQVRFIDVGDAATVIAFRPDGQALAVACRSRVSLWSVAGNQISALAGEIKGGVQELAYGQSGYVVAYGIPSLNLSEPYQELKVWQAATGQLVLSQTDIYMFSRAVDLSADGKTLVFWSPDGLEVRDLQTGEVSSHLSQIGADAIFSPDGTKVFFTSTDDNSPVQVWELARDKTTAVLEQMPCLYLARNGPAAICYGREQVVVFDPAQGQALKTLALADIARAAISPDGQKLAFIEQEQIKILEVQTEQTVKELEFDIFRTFAVGQVGLDNADKYVAATSGYAGRIFLWDLETGNRLRSFQASAADIDGLAFSPDRHILASIDAEGFVRLWDLQKSEVTYSFDFSGQALDPLRFSPDGSHLAMSDVNRDGILEFDLQTGQMRAQRYKLIGYPYANQNYAPFGYTSDNRLMTWGFAGPVDQAEALLVRDLSSNTEVKLPYTWKSDPDFLEAIALSSDGNYLAAGAAGGVIYIWDMRTQTLVAQMTGHAGRFGDGWLGALRYVDFSPQSDLLVSVGWDDTIRLWNIHTGNAIRQFNVCCFANFSPDGRVLTTAGEGVVRVWGLPPWP